MNITAHLIVILLPTLFAWNYEDGEEGPANWAKLNKACGGINQSPVNIPSYTKSKKFNFKKFVRSRDYDSLTYVNITKDDHTVSIVPLYGKNFLYGGPLKGKYILDNIHFHWGDKDNRGSEHTLKGYRSSMEMHVVNYNAKYSNASVASGYPDGLAVVAYLFRVTGYRYKNSALSTITEDFPKLQQPYDTTITLNGKIKLSQLAVPFNNNYATYFGSLTTPPCSEAVTWIVYKNVLSVSLVDMARFRSLYDSTPSLRNNFRPQQKINVREIMHKLE